MTQESDESHEQDPSVEDPAKSISPWLERTIWALPRLAAVLIAVSWAKFGPPHLAWIGYGLLGVYIIALIIVLKPVRDLGPRAE